MPLSRQAFSAPAPEAARPIVSARTRPLLSNRRVEPLPSLAALLICAAPVPLFAQADTAPQPDRPAAETTLPAIEVRGQAEQGSRSYQGDTTSIGKTPQLPKDVPQSITVIPSPVIQDQASDSLRSVLRNVPGLPPTPARAGGSATATTCVASIPSATSTWTASATPPSTTARASTWSRWRSCAAMPRCSSAAARAA